MKPKPKIFFLFLNFLIIILAVFSSPVFADTPIRVLALPFDIHSEKDLIFLQKGVEDMLSSRLSMEGKVVLIGKGETRQAIKDITKPINPETALSLAEKFGADYVVLGSLTVFGDSISTDARFMDVHQKKPVVVFNQFGKTHGDVISHINRFAAQVNEQVFGRKTVAYPTSSPIPEQKVADETRKNPESLWTPENRSGAYVYGAPEVEGKAHFAFWRSRKFETTIRGIAIGDVDGDGKNETVFISDNKLFIYRLYNQRFHKINEITGSNFDEFLGVDIADINGNGKAEIFVTNLSSNSRQLRSFVLEWNGAEFVKIEENAKWYFRVINDPERGGDLLLGQKQGGEDELFSRKGVYELIWNNGQYEPAQLQDLPKKMSVYGFTYGNVLNDGEERILALSDDGYIRILNKNGKEEWKSSDRFGGSTTYLSVPYEPDAAEPPSERLRDHFYLPQRIHIADLDQDGKNEVVVVKNISVTGHLLSRIRIFKSGHIEALDMDELGASLKWKTREISGYISDYTLADMDNDGKNELVFSVVAKTTPLLGKAKSFLVAQEISQ